MFPQNYFSLFPPFPRENRVFIAMSFDDKFNPRWENVISPVIRSIEINGISLEPHRVDTSLISDSILTEILGGIDNDYLIFADVTTLAQVGKRFIRNGNVMYEIGLAHAVRLPEEVLIFRSDKDSLLFDIANVRVNYYNPDNDPEEAKLIIRRTIIDAVKEIDLKRNLAVRKSAQSLDYYCFIILQKAIADGFVEPFPIRTMGEALGNSAYNNAISHLLVIGALQTDVRKLTPDLINQPKIPAEKVFRYIPTVFGKIIYEYIELKLVGDLENIRFLIKDEFS